MRPRTLSLLFLVLASAAPAAAQDSPPGGDAVRIARAAPLDGTLKIDGRLDESAWTTAPASSDFTESYPDRGAPANERTEFRVLYDAQAVYVGVRMFDSRPDSIAAPLARRDMAGIYSDWLHVMIDSYHDRRTGFRFTVNPRGVQRDVYISNDNSEDGSWDAVWDVATQIDSLGWTAEYRIPLSQLRFGAAGDGDERVWGLQLMRDIARREQRFSWAPWDRQTAGFVSRFGELRGLVGVDPVRRMEVQPYVSAKLTRAPAEPGNPFYSANDRTPGVGADVKLGLTTGLTLTATINPDFGQVEQDPATINLSAFESFFSERRPFFVEGADVFRFGQIRSNIGLEGQNFFYSRRIGRTPQRFVRGADVLYVDAPMETTILGAAKITGKAGPWTLGIMDALTAREEAVYRTPSGTDVRTPVEPRTNYLLSRVRRDLRGGASTIGAMVSATNRDLSDEVFVPMLRSDAYFAGVDFEHSWNDRTWAMTGYVGGSRIEGSPEAITRAQLSPARYFQRPDAKTSRFDPTRTSLQGHIAEVAIQRTGSWDLSLGAKESSPGFELNDGGFMGIAGYRTLTGFVGKRVERGTLFRDRAQYVFSGSQWNFDGDHTTMLIGFGFNGTLNRLWSLGLEGGVQPSTFDERFTRGGPLARSPAGWRTRGFVESPSRNRVSFGANYSLTGNAAGGFGRSVGLNADWRPNTAVRLRGGPNLSRNFGTGQYVTTVADERATGTFGRRYVFGEIDQTMLSLSARLDWTFTPRLSLQLYAQPLLAAGDFENFKEFTTPRAYDFAVYGQTRGTICRFGGGLAVDPVAQRSCPAVMPAAGDPNFTLRFGSPDFNIRSLQGNAVLRWEYRPGSALFLVWQQQRDGFAPLGNFDFTRDAGAVFNTPSTNVFLLKATYWIGR